MTASRPSRARVVIWAADVLKAQGIDVLDPKAFNEKNNDAIRAAFATETRARRRSATAAYEATERGAGNVRYRQCDHDAVSDLIADLEARVAHLTAALVDTRKKAAGMVYRGIWRDGTKAAPGDTFTHGGSIWHCDAPTETRPGDDPAAWTLACKRGRDGKDAR